jgi:hypothetical protein
MTERDKARPLMPAATREQQARIAILRAIAYRVAHPAEQRPLSWSQEQPRKRTTRVILDIDTSDLRVLIARIAHSPIGRQPSQSLKPGKLEPLPPQPR